MVEISVVQKASNQ